MDSEWQAWAERALVPREPVHVATRLGLVAPQGGERLPAGAPYLVLWGSTTDTIRNVKLFYQVGGGAWIPIVDSMPQAGSFVWDVPATAGDGVRIRISSLNGVWKDTTGAFAIVEPTAMGPGAAAPVSRILWHAEPNGVRFLGVPDQARVRVLDAKGREVWSTLNNGGPVIWRFGAKGGWAAPSLHMVELSVPGHARVLRAIPMRMIFRD
jgi:hypothetical protein